MWIYVFKWEKQAKDWVLASDIEDAKDFYLRHTGCGDLEECEVSRVKKSEWTSHFILDLDHPEPDHEDGEYNEDDYISGYKIQESFAEYAARERTTDLIATTEY